ncbi:MAG: hypothetical protein MUO59_06265 [Actinobacteria bacterium]|nr:hypothetical protein [Actinomycetota bacterium]
MEFLLAIIQKIGPFQGAAILALAVFISLFTSFSPRKSAKIFSIAINALAYAGALYLYVHSYIRTGPFSGFLVKMELRELILLGVVIFCALNVLFYISFYRIYDNSFIRTITILTFTVISISFLVIASNFILMFASFTVSVFNIFAIISSTNPGRTASGEAIGKFGIRTALAPVLFFFGFSVLYGSGEIRSFLEVPGLEHTGNPFILIGTIVFACGLFLYLFLYPFQGPYLKLARRINGEALPVLWFLYIPLGIITFIKFEVFFNIFLQQAGIVSKTFIAVILLLSLIGANTGAVRTSSLKRIIAMLVLFSVGNIIFSRVQGLTGLESAAVLQDTNILGLGIMIAGFMPLCLLMVFTEKGTGNDSILNLRGFAYRKTYITICIILILLWWLYANIYISPLTALFDGGNFNYPGTVQIIILALYFLAWLLATVNIFRMIIVFFSRNAAEGTLKDLTVPKVFYFYFTIFILAAISTVVLSWQGLL